MSKRLKSTIAMLLMVAMLVGMVPAMELPTALAATASCEVSGYSGGNANPFVQGETVGVDYTVPAGYYNVAKGAANYAMTTWAQSCDELQYLVSENGVTTNTERSLVAATNGTPGTPMYMHYKHTAWGGTTRSTGWISNFARDDTRYYTIDEVRYFVVVYRSEYTHGTSGGNIQPFWAISQRGYEADLDWFTNTKGYEGIDITDLCYGDDSTQFGWKAEGTHYTGILSAPNYYLAASSEWTYAVIDMMHEVDTANNYWQLYNNFASGSGQPQEGNDVLISTHIKSGSNSSRPDYLQGECVAGVGIGLPIYYTDDNLDISHIAYFSSASDATDFGDAALDFHENPGTYSGATIAIESNDSGTEVTYTPSSNASYNHTYTTSVTAPTCTEQGYTLHRCTNCGYSYKENYTQATGHSAVNGLCSICDRIVCFEGKKISILGDSISTYTGVSNNTAYNSTIGGNWVHYDGTQYSPSVKLDDTWWMQAIDTLGMELVVNNSWSGSCVFDWAFYTYGAYQTRCEQLHNNDGEEPDIIAYYMGTNDFRDDDIAYGTAADIAYEELITQNGSTYSYATPTTFCEAYAITIHKMTQRYPNAEIYCFTILPSTRHATEYVDGVSRTELLPGFNDSIKAIAEHFEVNVVDLYEDSGITADNETFFDFYVVDADLHPVAPGMDAITGTFLSSLYENSKYSPKNVNKNNVSNITYNLNEDVIVKEGTAYAVLTGQSFSCSFMSLNGTGAQATVTMGGKNITAEVYKDGVITIPEVTGDIVITAKEGIPHNYELVVTAPTCTDKGYTTYTCSCGDSYVVSETEATGHSHNAVVTNPTCADKGYTTYTCSCGDSYVADYVDALGHSYSSVVTAPTCTAGGYTTHTCSVCGDSYTDAVVSALGHSWVAADCDTPKTCSVCGAIEGNSNGHSYEAVVTKPTCTEGGYTIYTCSACGDSYKADEVASKGHTWVDATCTGAKYCSVCGITDGDGTGHSYETAVTKPTCTEGGYTTYTCSVCGYNYKADEVAALGHSWVDADCDTPKTCSVCGATEGEPLGHVDSNDNIRCDRCNELVKPAHLRRVSISLAGKIAINYYMLLSDAVVADQTAYMQFRLADGEVIRIPATEGVKTEYYGETYYVFTCYVSAKEMTDDVLSQFFYTGGSTEAAKYNVKTYAEVTLANNNASDELKELVQAMLNYGAAAQMNFGYNTDNLAGEAPDYSDVTIAGYTINANQGTELAKFYSASLILKSATTLRFFFRVDSSVANFTATYNGQKLAVSQRSGLYYVDVVGISAQDLGEEVTITIHDGTSEATVTFNPMSYCQGVITDTEGYYDENLKNLAAALYLYNQAAIKYFR